MPSTLHGLNVFVSSPNHTPLPKKQIVCAPSDIEVLNGLLDRLKDVSSDLADVHCRLAPHGFYGRGQVRSPTPGLGTLRSGMAKSN